MHIELASFTVDCKYTEWGDWSPCNEMCEQTRNRWAREVLNGNGKECDELDMTIGCFDNRVCIGK